MITAKKKSVYSIVQEKEQECNESNNYFSSLVYVFLKNLSILPLQDR